MGIEEIALLTAAKQLSQAVGAYLKRISPSTTNVYAVAACAVGYQIAANAAVAFDAGIKAASSEFSTTWSAESAVNSTLQGLPPIT